MPKAAATAVRPAPHPSSLRFIGTPPPLNNPANEDRLLARDIVVLGSGTVKDAVIDSFRVLDNLSGNRLDFFITDSG